MSPECVVGIWEKNNNVVSCSPFHVAQSLDHRVIPEDERGVSTVEFNMEAACFLQARVGHVEVALIGKVALRVRRRLLVNCVQVTRLLVVFVFRLKITIQITEDFIGHVVAALWHTRLKRMGWCTAGHWIEEIVGLHIVREHVAEVVNPQPLDISTLLFKPVCCFHCLSILHNGVIDARIEEYGLVLNSFGVIHCFIINGFRAVYACGGARSMTGVDANTIDLVIKHREKICSHEAAAGETTNCK